jgi:hypothetical protein
MYICLAKSSSYDIFVLLLVEAKSISRGGQSCLNFIKRLITLARNLLLKICANLIEFLKQIIFSETFFNSHRRSPKDFIRERILPFHTMIFFLTNLIKGSIQDELDYFFKALHGKDIAERTVTKSAFTKARRKLRHQAFIELGRNLISFFYNHFPCRKWKGFRLLTIDGSTVQVPRSKDVAEHFGVWHPTGGGECPIAMISHLYDALNGVTLDALIRPKEQGERLLAAEHVKHLTPGDLVLLDRGYPAFWLFVLIIARGAHFCSRIKEAHWDAVRSFFLSENKEQIITLYPSPASLKKCREFCLPIVPLHVRIIRVDLDDGETEVLVTSLMDDNLYPHEIFKDLYHLRWMAEENYKTAKHRVEIENFSGKTVESVYQDFHAKTFAMNLAAVLSHPAQDVIAMENESKKHPYKINVTQALSKMKDSIFLLFKHDNIMELLKKLFVLFINTIEPVRPGRFYPRKHKPKRGFYPCYKPIR